MNNRFSELSTLGWSPLTIACYEQLYFGGMTTVRQLATRVQRQPANLYRVLRELETVGFVRCSKAGEGPTYYRAVPVEHALDDYLAYYRYHLLPIIREQRRRRPLPPSWSA